MIDDAFVHYLKSLGALAQVIENRVFPDTLPQGEKRPSVVWQQITGERLRIATGPEGFGEPHFQVKCWAELKSDAKAMAIAIIGQVGATAIDGYSGWWGPTEARYWVQNAEVHAVQDLYEDPVAGEDSGSYCVMFDVHVWYNEV